MTTISIEVDANAARTFCDAPIEERARLQLLLDLRLRELTTAVRRPLHEIMDDIGLKAESEGLDEEKLKSLLGEE